MTRRELETNCVVQTSRSLNRAGLVVGRDAVAHKVDDLQRQLLAQILARTERVIVHDDHVRLLVRAVCDERERFNVEPKITRHCEVIKGSVRVRSVWRER
jgi:hypothetical protein